MESLLGPQFSPFTGDVANRHPSGARATPSANDRLVPVWQKCQIAFRLGQGQSHRAVGEATGRSKGLISEISSWIRAPPSYSVEPPDMMKQLKKHFVWFCLLSDPKTTYKFISDKAEKIGLTMGEARICRYAKEVGFMC